MTNFIMEKETNIYFGLSEIKLKEPNPNFIFTKQHVLKNNHSINYKIDEVLDILNFQKHFFTSVLEEIHIFNEVKKIILITF